MALTAPGDAGKPPDFGYLEHTVGKGDVHHCADAANEKKRDKTCEHAPAVQAPVSIGEPVVQEKIRDGGDQRRKSLRQREAGPGRCQDGLQCREVNGDAAYPHKAEQQKTDGNEPANTLSARSTRYSHTVSVSSLLSP